jgi:hypothetical protein
VLDREWDLAVGKSFKRKADTVRWFVKNFLPKIKVENEKETD